MCFLLFLCYVCIIFGPYYVANGHLLCLFLGMLLLSIVCLSFISEDEEKRYENEIQKMTDDSIKKVDEVLAQKEKDIMQV